MAPHIQADDERGTAGDLGIVDRGYVGPRVRCDVCLVRTILYQNQQEDQYTTTFATIRYQNQQSCVNKCNS